MKHYSSKGFTITELLIVVAIMGIIAAIAFPNWQESVRKSNRSDGKTALLRLMQKQQQFYTDNVSYTTTLTAIGAASDANVVSAERYYTVSAAACAGMTIAQCVILTATPDPNRGQGPDGALTLNSLGQKTPAANW